MKILIKQARITDPNSPHNGQTTDIFIDNGIITRIGNGLTEKADHEISLNGLHVSPGWVDLFANFADPGYEYKETLETGAQAAAAGGFTDVFIIPNTKPVIQDKSAVEYIKQKSRDLPVTIHPLGAVTKNAEGKDLAEMYDMRNSGAIAFSDGLNSIQSSGLLVKALQYVKAFNGIIMQLPDDKSINPQGLVNEGIVSTRMGLPGKPAMAEELVVARDIKLAAYASSKLHLTGVSTRQSIAYIKEGKESGVDISCSVTPYHLYFCDEDLHGYQTNLKVNPPLRTREEMEALRKALINGAIDCIATHHLPHEFDSKVMEFEYAKYGMTGLETAFAVIRTAVPELPISKMIELLALNPRKIFGLPAATIQEGSPATLSLFNPDLEWTYQISAGHSKSGNSPFDSKQLTGKVLGIVNQGQLILS